MLRPEILEDFFERAAILVPSEPGYFHTLSGFRVFVVGPVEVVGLPCLVVDQAFFCQDNCKAVLIFILHLVEVKVLVAVKSLGFYRLGLDLVGLLFWRYFNHDVFGRLLGFFAVEKAGRSEHLIFAEQKASSDLRTVGFVRALIIFSD